MRFMDWCSDVFSSDLPLGKAHPCLDLLLQIEGQPILGPSGDAMQMAADGPEKILRPLKLPQFAWREEANVDKFRHRTNAMHIFADPEQGMQIAKPPPSLPSHWARRHSGCRPSVYAAALARPISRR